jgi:hypothetical protein
MLMKLNELKWIATKDTGETEKFENLSEALAYQYPNGTVRNIDRQVLPAEKWMIDGYKK